MIYEFNLNTIIIFIILYYKEKLINIKFTK
jgi:hypothetical protein